MTVVVDIFVEMVRRTTKRCEVDPLEGYIEFMADRLLKRHLLLFGQLDRLEEQERLSAAKTSEFARPEVLSRSDRASPKS